MFIDESIGNYKTPIKNNSKDVQTKFEFKKNFLSKYKGSKKNLNYQSIVKSLKG
jgi:hypothetical protein